jgi:hypothetical protein
MTEITRAPKPAQPIAPDSVTRYHELRNLYASNFQNLAPIAERGNSGEATPSPELLCRDQAEVWNWREGRAEYKATDAERLAAFEVSARATIALIEARILSARELLAHHEAHRTEIETYDAEVNEWLRACDEIDRAYYEAREEAHREEKRARYVVGTRVNVYRARHPWEIIARNGKGAIIREIRWDDKPARVREVVDVLAVD